MNTGYTPGCHHISLLFLASTCNACVHPWEIKLIVLIWAQLANIAVSTFSGLPQNSHRSPALASSTLVIYLPAISPNDHSCTAQHTPSEQTWPALLNTQCNTLVPMSRQTRHYRITRFLVPNYYCSSLLSLAKQYCSWTCDLWTYHALTSYIS